MKQSHQEKMSVYRKGKGYITAAKEDTDKLREIAQKLGFVVTRGEGAGIKGDPKDIIELLVRAYDRDPDAILSMFKEWQRSGSGSPVPDHE